MMTSEANEAEAKRAARLSIPRCGDDDEEFVTTRGNYLHQKRRSFERGAAWQAEQDHADEPEIAKVAAQRAVKIAELDAEVAELTEALTATHRSGERDLQKMESAWGELAALKAKLAKVRVLAEADKRCPCCSGYGHILAILDGETE